MAHVRNIFSNVKGLDPSRNICLGEKTLIVGPNGAGKSAIVNSIELLSGFASDVRGRERVKQKATLASLAASGNLSVRAELSDGRQVSHGGAESVTFRFPVSEVKTAITGSAERARAYLLSRSTGEVAREDVLAWFG